MTTKSIRIWKIKYWFFDFDIYFTSFWMANVLIHINFLLLSSSKFENYINLWFIIFCWFFNNNIQSFADYLFNECCFLNMKIRQEKNSLLVKDFTLTQMNPWKSPIQAKLRQELNYKHPFILTLILQSQSKLN